MTENFYHLDFGLDLSFVIGNLSFLKSMEDKTRAKIKCQIELQQAEEELRKLRNQMATMEIQSRQYHQEYTRAEMNLHDIEAKTRNLKVAEFGLSQKITAAKKALMDCISGR